MIDYIITIDPDRRLEYLQQNITRVTIADFFQLQEVMDIPAKVIGQNSLLASSTEVLKYTLTKDKLAYKYFSPAAFDEEIIDIVATEADSITPFDASKNPYLLTNQTIREKFISNYPECISMFKDEYITDSIISILEEHKEALPPYKLLNNKKLRTNKILRKKTIKTYPKVIVNLNDVSDDEINIALENGYEPAIEDIIDNSQLETNTKILNRLFFIYPETIKYFKEEDITEDTINSVLERGFIASEEDFRKQPVLMNNKDILIVAIIRDPKLINLVSNDNATEIIQTIKQYKIEAENYDDTSSIEPIDISKNPFLLTNKDIRDILIAKHPECIHLLTEVEITDDIIQILTESKYALTPEQLIRSDKLKSNQVLRERTISKYPYTIVKLDDVTEDDIYIATDNGFEPEKSHFIKNPKLKETHFILRKAFLNDPNLITYFKDFDISPGTVEKALEAGYIASEEDLLTKPYLRSVPYIFTSAVINEPELIKLALENTYINPLLPSKIYKKYRITAEDVRNNPELARNASIILALPELSSYSKFLNPSEKRKLIIEKLKNKEKLSGEELPFLEYDFGGTANIDNLNLLLERLYVDVDENDPNAQQYYKTLFDKLINGVIDTRYDDQKPNFMYHDIIGIHQVIEYYFEKALSENNPQNISSLVNNLYLFVGPNVATKLEIEDRIETLFNKYRTYPDLTIDDTKNVANYILNLHRNKFVSQEKRKLIPVIRSKIKYTSKKETTIINGKKLNTLIEIIKNKNFEALGITEDEYTELLTNAVNTACDHKDLKKANINITEQQRLILIKTFKMNGHIDTELVKRITGINDEEIAKYITKKMENTRLQFMSKITLSDEEKEKAIEEAEIDGLNYSDYLFADKNRYYENLADLLLSLDDDRLNKILRHEFSDGIKNLLLFSGIMDEFNTDAYVSILCDYKRIENKTKSITAQKNKGYDELNELGNFIMLGRSYSSITDLTLSALGVDTATKLEGKRTAQYMDINLEMVKRNTTTIPAVSLKYGDYYLESGRFIDSQRLIIGKVPNEDSCVDIEDRGSAGADTYKEAMLGPNGDVILVKDKFGNLVSRVLVFRRGNVVHMTTTSGERFHFQMYQQIADQMMKQIKAAGDNIDFIFINTHNILEDKTASNRNVQDQRLRNCFPHADYNPYAYLLKAKDESSFLYTNITDKFDFDAEPTATYQPLRAKPKTNVTTEDVDKIRALDILLETDPKIKEEKSRDFEPYIPNEFENVIMGDDWFLGQREDGSIEKIILPTATERTMKEIDEYKAIISPSSSTK